MRISPRSTPVVRHLARFAPVALALCAPTFSPSLSPSARAAPASAVKVYPVSPSQLKSAIARHKGKVVLVNFWASWCSPCLSELPAFARFARANQKNVAVILVSADDSSEKSTTQAALQKRGHASTLLVRGDLPAFMQGFDPTLKGAIALPVTYVYNRQGRKVKVVREEEQTEASLQKLVAPYLR